MEPFITVDQLSAYVRRDLTGELMAEIAVGSACETVRDYLGQMMTSVIDDEVFVSADGSDALLLPELPVVDVTSVAIRSSRDDIPNIDVPSTFYWLDQRKGILYTRPLGGLWIKGHGVYAVTYSHGWDSPIVSSGSGDVPGSGDPVFDTIPRPLQLIALTLAARILDQGLVKAETVGMYQSIYASDESLGLTMGELNMLAKYRPGRVR